MELAPFLGRHFEGTQGVGDYLGLVSSLLAFDELSLSEYVVDPEEKKVATKGRSLFKWKDTGESWDEAFAHVLDFDDEAKVVRYQIWADSGVAYLASKTGLENLRKVSARNSTWISSLNLCFRSPSTYDVGLNHVVATPLLRVESVTL